MLGVCLCVWWWCLCVGRGLCGGRCLTTTTTHHQQENRRRPWKPCGLARPQATDLRPQATDSQGKGPSAILYLAFFVGAAFSFSPKTRNYEIRAHRPGLPRQQNISTCDCFAEFAGQLRWAGLAQNVLFGRPKPHAKTPKYREPGGSTNPPRHRHVHTIGRVGRSGR